MAAGIGQIHVRKMRGKLSVIGMGQTPRGQTYPKRVVELTVKTPGDSKFKNELAHAVEDIINQSGFELP